MASDMIWDDRSWTCQIDCRTPALPGGRDRGPDAIAKIYRDMPIVGNHRDAH